MGSKQTILLTPAKVQAKQGSPLSAHRLQILDVLQVQVVKAVMEAAVAVATAALNTEDAQEIVQRSARGFAHEIVEMPLALAPVSGQQTTRTYLRMIRA